MSNSEIRFVKYSEIDFQKWDQCIAASPFGISYAYSWYLDRICPHWDALVWGNYLYVMPLVNAMKFGMRYIYQPFFTQQLGVFSSFPPETGIVNQFLHAIPSQFRLTDMNLNIGNIPAANNFILKKRTTCELSLQSDAEILRKKYAENTRRNIQKALRYKIYISPVYDLVQFMEFTKNNLKLKAPEVQNRHYSALLKVISFAVYNNYGEILGAYDSGNNLVAAAFFLSSNQKSIFLAASSNVHGTEQSAMFLLIDRFIQNNAGRNLTLDFEGSDIPGIARFYQGFGAHTETYYAVHQNRLPFPLRLLKK